MRVLVVRLPFAALAAGGLGLGLMACAAVIGVDGDYVEGDVGGAAGAGAGTAGAPTGGTGAGASGGSGTTSSGGSGAGGAATTTGGAGGSGGPGGSGGAEPLPLGAPCTAPDACASARCVDDVCCDAACDGLCERCDAAELLGDCTPIPAGENPDGDCDDGDLQACTGGNACKGLPGAPCANNGQCLSSDCDGDTDTCN